MIQAAEENIHGSPIPPRTEGDRIISKWIAPIKAMALDQLQTESNAAATSSDDHPHTSYDPLSPHALATLTDNHVAETVRLVSESSVVQDAWDQGMELSVHGWVYHVATARLRDLDIGVRGVGIPAFSLGSRPSSYAGSAPASSVGSDGEESSDEEEKEVRKSGF